MSNRVESAPPVIVKVAGMVPTVSASVEVSAATNGLVLGNRLVANVVITGALSLTSATLTVIVFGVGLSRRRPSPAPLAVGAGRRAMRLEVRRVLNTRLPPTMSTASSRPRP